PALLWGVAVANIVRGVAIDADMHYVGTFFDLLNPYALLGGLVTLTLFTLHGALFLELKTDGVIRERASRLTGRVWLPLAALAVLFLVFSASQTDMYAELNTVKLLALAAAVISLLAAGYFIRAKRFGRAFLSTGILIIAVVALLFGTM